MHSGGGNPLSSSSVQKSVLEICIIRGEETKDWEVRKDGVRFSTSLSSREGGWDEKTCR